MCFKCYESVAPFILSDYEHIVESKGGSGL